MSDRCITFWRKPGEKCLDWDFHVSDHIDDVKTVVHNLKARKVTQYRTFRLGNLLPELSSDF